MSLPCVLGYNVWSWDGFSIFGGAVLDLEDFLVSNILLPLGSLVYLLFCTSRYGWGWKNFKAEANTGKGFKMQEWMRVYLSYILPLMILFTVSYTHLCSCGERKSNRYCEEQCRKQYTDDSVSAYHISYKISKCQVIRGADTGQSPCQRQDHDCRCHGFESLYKAFAELAEGDDSSKQIEKENKY